jgi:hypothetical protein
MARKNGVRSSADRHPRQSGLQDNQVEQQAPQSAVAVQKGMDGDELEVRHQRPSDPAQVRAGGERLQAVDEIPHPQRIRRRVAPSIQTLRSGAPTAELADGHDPGIDRRAKRSSYR